MKATKVKLLSLVAAAPQGPRDLERPATLAMFGSRGIAPSRDARWGTPCGVSLGVWARTHIDKGAVLGQNLASAFVAPRRFLVGKRAWPR